MASIDHNYGGEDALAYHTPQRTGIEKAEVKVFNKSDWDGGRRSSRYLVGRVGTTTAGRWTRSLDLKAGEYILVFACPGKFGPDVQTISVKG